MPFSWAFEPAYHSAYQPLPVKLLKTELPVTLHWAAPLLQMLKWRDPVSVDTLKNGIETGQFEIMGSAYAQNIMVACSEWANKGHLDLNLQVLENVLGVAEPKGFWNPERVWQDSLLDLIMDSGYKYTLLESTELAKDGSPEYRTRKRQTEQGDFHFISDSQKLLHQIDGVIWTGDTTHLNILCEEIAEDKNNQIVYAQDAEAAGFWQVSQGMSQKQVNSNLDSLFDYFKENTWIELAKLQDFTKEGSINNSKLNDVQATWMVESVQADGYKDWWEYLSTAPELKYYNQLFENIETEFHNAENLKDNGIYKVAKSIYLSHQFEYGCAPGSQGTEDSRYLMNVPGHMLLEGVRQSQDILSNLSQNQAEGPFWNYETSSPQIIWNTNSISTVWSPIGGRCVRLIDLKKEKMITPNPFFNYSRSSVSDINYSSPNFNFPDYETSIQFRDFLFEDNVVVDRKSIGEPYLKEINYRSGKPSESIYSNSVSHTYYQTQIIPHKPEIVFQLKINNLYLVKRVRIHANLIDVEYSIKNNSDNEKELSIGFSASPDPMKIMCQGKEVVKSSFSEGDINSLIVNLETNSGITISSTEKPNQITMEEIMFGYTHRWKFLIDGDSKDVQSFNIRVST
jgi:hypothetical protein